ncbi:MAG: glycosyltransferase [Cytophagales bacterium]|nr:glycosyltransferase [Cytophagales bacterium]
MRILQVNISDTRGGASVVAWNLHQGFKQAGLKSYMAVKISLKHDENIITLDNESERTFWYKKNFALAKWFDTLSFPGKSKIAALLRWIASPEYYLKDYLGMEYFNFPASRAISLSEYDIIHCHVLHGEYFDLRLLATWSRKLPVVITLHDAWLLAGHCAHSFDCTKWKTGCMGCPDLTIPVPIKRDNAHFNWKQKKNIFESSNLYITTPCKWLQDKALSSILAKGIKRSKVIHNGVNQTMFRPGDRASLRSKLEIADDEFVMMFVANGIRKNRWKDFYTLNQTMAELSKEFLDGRFLLLAVGEEGDSYDVGNGRIVFIPYQDDPLAVAELYGVSDVYLHSAKADTFPNAVLEALSCGVPVVASAIGGIVEQIKGLNLVGGPQFNNYPIEEATGILVESNNSKSFAESIKWIKEHPMERKVMGYNAAADAKVRFGWESHLASYIGWYKEILSDFKHAL